LRHWCHLKKIEVLQPTNTKDPDGFNTQNLTPICPTVWAYFRQLSGKEIYAGGATIATEQVLITINWLDDITTAHVIRYRGFLYDITRVDVFEGYKGDITLYARLRG
jgi:SPP1 family predicted phage head-tail adaptor